MSEKILKRELNEALGHIRVLMAAPFESKDKVDFIDLKEEIVELISVETDKKEKLFKEKREAVFETIKKEVSKEEDRLKKEGVSEFKNKESMISALIQDDPVLAKIAREKADFWSTPVINKLPFVLKPGLTPPEGSVSLVINGDAGQVQKVPIGPSFEWLVEKGFIDVSTKTTNKNGSK